MGLRRLPVSKSLIELLAREGWSSAVPADPHDLEVVGARMSRDGHAVELLVASDRFTGEAKSFDDSTPLALNFRRGPELAIAERLTGQVAELDAFLRFDGRESRLPTGRGDKLVTEVAMQYIEALELELVALTQEVTDGKRSS